MIEQWVNMIVENSILVEPDTQVQVVKNDPSDDKFIEAGIAGKADFIVSQDKHLLKIKSYRGVNILNPEEFLKHL